MPDAAFQWETEALRSSPSAARRHDTPRPRHPSASRGEPTSAAQPGEPAEAAEPPLQVPPPGTMIVPISAWEKMLHQLGNLHEAGRDLAEARERAARAETEAKFLRERLAELRLEATEPTKGLERSHRPMGRVVAPVRATTLAAAGLWARLRRAGPFRRT